MCSAIEGEARAREIECLQGRKRYVQRNQSSGARGGVSRQSDRVLWDAEKIERRQRNQWIECGNDVGAWCRQSRGSVCVDLLCERVMRAEHCKECRERCAEPNAAPQSWGLGHASIRTRGAGVNQFPKRSPQKGFNHALTTHSLDNLPAHPKIGG